MLPNKLVFLDVETTGASIYRDRVIEIGLIRVEQGREVVRYQTLLNPEMTFSPYIEQMTGITRAMTRNQPVFAEVADQLEEWLHDAVLVAHNARFDYAFLKAEFGRLSRPFSMKQLCTIRLSRRLYPGYPRHNLDALIERFHLQCARRHRAFDDAHVLWQFYQIIQAQRPAAQVEAAVSAILRRPAIPAKLAAHHLENLPETSGVYIFWGEGNYPLYVGKSVNLRERVLSHFHDDMQSSRHLQMCQRVERIEVRPTAGELGALLTESALVKELQPLYNRLLRRKKEMILLLQGTDSRGYATAEYRRVQHIDPAILEQVIGIFESERRAAGVLQEIAKNHQLCLKLLGVERTSSRCFGAQLGSCRGACTGDEIPVAYNIRFTAAFGRSRIRPWIASGPLMYRERSTEGLEEVFVVDKWCLVERRATQPESQAAVARCNNPMFDLDTYRILARHLLKLPTSQLQPAQPIGELAG